jgi:uncharacterized protein (DUF433 family)/DNA-binding transcriptional MerR regulator
MAFPVPLAVTLSGATVDQLAYWRRRTPSHPALLEPDAKRSGRYLYSWADVIALRSIVYLRQDKSLPRIRAAVQTLARLQADEWTHLSRYKLASTGDSIVVVTPRGEILDVGKQPGTILDEVLLGDVLGVFQTADGRSVPSLPQPRDHLSVDPGVLGGYPVVTGTRVPYDVIAGLADDGYDEAEIIEMYPSVRGAAVADASAFAKEVAAAA